MEVIKNKRQLGISQIISDYIHGELKDKMFNVSPKYDIYLSESRAREFNKKYKNAKI
jgi:hypothetical protein